MKKILFFSSFIILHFQECFCFDPNFEQKEYSLPNEISTFANTSPEDLSSNKEDASLAGNVKDHYPPREYGKVSNDDAGNIFRPFYIGNESYQFMFSVAYTLFAPYQEGLLLATSNQQGKSIYPHTSAYSGFNVSIAKYLHYDDWIASLEYCWFYNQNNLRNNYINITLPYQSPWINETDQDILAIDSLFNYQFNTLYLSLYRNTIISKTFLFTPKIGLVGAWEEQDFNFDMDATIAPTTYIYHFRNHQEWWATGPLAGIKTAFLFYPNIQLFIIPSAGITLAKHYITQSQKKTSITPPIATALSSFNHDYWNVEPMLSIELGLDAFYNFSKAAMFGKISWQFQNWFQHNGFMIPLSQPISGSYAMQGLILEIGVAF